MDSLFVPPITPAIRPAYVGEGSAANISGQGYSNAPRVGGAGAAAGTSGVVAKLSTGGYAVLGVGGGYYAPKTQRIT